MSLLSSEPASGSSRLPSLTLWQARVQSAPCARRPGTPAPGSLFWGSLPECRTPRRLRGCLSLLLTQASPIREAYLLSHCGPSPFFPSFSLPNIHFPAYLLCLLSPPSNCKLHEGKGTVVTDVLPRSGTGWPEPDFINYLGNEEVEDLPRVVSAVPSVVCVLSYLTLTESTCDGPL